MAEEPGDLLAEEHGSVGIMGGELEAEVGMMAGSRSEPLWAYGASASVSDRWELWQDAVRGAGDRPCRSFTPPPLPPPRCVSPRKSWLW